MDKIDAAVAIITNEKLECLLQKKDLGYLWFPGKWCFFGGGIEEGEEPLDTIKRELIEEGIPVKWIKFLEHSFYEDRTATKTRQGREYIFHAEFSGRISDIRLNEGGGFAFFARSELKYVPIVEHDLRAIERFYNSLRA